MAVLCVYDNMGITVWWWVHGSSDSVSCNRIPLCRICTFDSTKFDSQICLLFRADD